MLFLAGHSAYMFFFPEIDIRTQQKQNNCDKNHSHSNDETTSVTTILCARKEHSQEPILNFKMYIGLLHIVDKTLTRQNFKFHAWLKNILIFNIQNTI